MNVEWHRTLRATIADAGEIFPQRLRPELDTGTLDATDDLSSLDLERATGNSLKANNVEPIVKK